MTDIDSFDIVSGKVAQTRRGTFWFKEPGHNMQENGWPIYDYLHRVGGPAIIWADDVAEYWVNGRFITYRMDYNKGL